MRSPPYKIPTNDAIATAQGLRELLDMAEKGKIVGLSWAAVDKDRKILCGTMGLMHRNLQLGHYATARLSEVLLWPDEEFL